MADAQLNSPESGANALAVLPDLTSLRAPISNGALKGEKLPARLKIFNWGDNPSTKGNFAVGQKTVAVLGANQRERGFERVAIDFGHASVPGSPEYVQGKVPPVFGSGRVAVIPNDGVFLEEIQWTPLGAKKARNFEDLSPAAAATVGEVDFIHSVALLPNGALYDVTFFSATATKPISPISPISPMDQNVILVSDLAPALGLAATAPRADVFSRLALLSALTPLAALVKDGKVTVLDSVTDLDTRLKTIEAANTRGIATLSATVAGKQVTITAENVVALSARLDAMEATIKAQADQTSQAEVTNLLTLMSAEGKAPVNPATRKPFASEELRKLDAGTLRILHANTPATVPLSARNRGATEGSGVDPKLKGRARVEAAFAMAAAN